MRGYIFCSGPIRDYEAFRKFSFDEGKVICADGGFLHARRMGIRPDMILGDCDSCEEVYPQDVPTQIFPAHKDFTDTNLAIDYAISIGCDEVILLGGIGGRIDHEFSHFCLLQYGLSKGIRIFLVDEKNEIWMENKSFELHKCAHNRKYVSFFPYGGDVQDFSVKGLLYTAEHMTLRCDRVQASSNAFGEEETAQISFSSGTVLVVLSDD